ncbi:MAG: hypothetical protein IKF53_02060 [Clostridia bacterium]|nr:hypothetical protein [Clostridia bacterium]
MTWNYTEDTATLTISGTGDMQDYSRSTSHYSGVHSIDTPWTDFCEKIKVLHIKMGVTYIGGFAFNNMILNCFCLLFINL